MTSGQFGKFVQLYRERGLWPRPIAPGTKLCPIKGWQRPDEEFDPATLTSWGSEYPHWGTGLLMGTRLPDDTLLAALDADTDGCVRLSKALFRNAPSGRIGKRGIVLFCRVRGDGKYRQFKNKDGAVGELLCTGRLCVLPPTIHPGTKAPYYWIGTPLHETDFMQLPLIEA